MAIERGFTNYLADLKPLKTGTLSIGGSNLFSSFVLPSLTAELHGLTEPVLSGIVKNGLIDFFFYSGKPPKPLEKQGIPGAFTQNITFLLRPAGKAEAARRA